MAIASALRKSLMQDRAHDSMHATMASHRHSLASYLEQLLCDRSTAIAVASGQEELRAARPLRQQGRENPQLPAAPLIKVGDEGLDGHCRCTVVGVHMKHLCKALCRAMRLKITGSHLTHCCGTTTAAMQHVVASVLARITRSCMTACRNNRLINQLAHLGIVHDAEAVVTIWKCKQSS